MEVISIILGSLLFLSLIFSWVFEKYKIPDVLPLFFLGLLLGPIFNVVDPEAFGKFGQVFSVITLSIVLFESGLHIRFDSLFNYLSKAAGLIFLNLITTATFVTFVSRFLFGTSYLMGAAIGTILAGTSATIIVPLIKELDIKKGTKTILKLESTLNNLTVIVITFALIEAMNAGAVSIGSVGTTLLTSFVYSIIIGSLAALLWSEIINKLRGVQNSLFTTPAFLLVIFGLAEILSASGAVSVLFFGIVLGNLEEIDLGRNKFLSRMRNFDFTLTKKEETFFSSLVFLVKTYFFVFIGLSISFENIPYIIYGGIIAAALFGIRFVIVELFYKNSLPKLDRLTVEAMIPKGLTEAALLTFIGNEFINSVSYPVIMFSIIYTGIFTYYLKKWSEKQKPIEEKKEGVEKEKKPPKTYSFHDLP